MKKNKKLWIKITAGGVLALQLFFLISGQQIFPWGGLVCGGGGEYYYHEKNQ